MTKLSATEVIRRQALVILANHPEGLSYSELKSLTEEALEEVFEPDSYNRGKFRSALYQIHMIYSPLMLRDDATKTYTPTEQLLNLVKKEDLIPSMEDIKKRFGILKRREPERSSLEVNLPTYITREEEELYEEGDIEKQKIVRDLKLNLIKIKYKELVKFIQESGLYELLKLTPHETQHISIEELEAIFRLKMQLELVAKEKNTLLYKRH